ARSRYVPTTKAFTPQNRGKALKLVDDMERGAASLSDAAFLLGIMRLAALAQNGHDSVDTGDRAWLPSTRLPLHFIWFPDGLVVVRAAQQFASLLGAHVTEIERLTPDQLLVRLRPFAGGTDSYRKWDLMWIVEHGDLLHALGIG